MSKRAPDWMLSAQYEAVDRSSPVPAWAQVARDLRRMIDNGELTAGFQLPRETELAIEYDVSRITVRQALSELSTAGYVERRQGAGTFISERVPPIQHDLSLRESWREVLRREGHTANSEVLQVTVVDGIPAPMAVDLLPGEAAQPVTRLRRLQYVDGGTIGLTESWIPTAVVPGLADTELIDASVSTTLAATFGMRTSLIVNTVDATLATPSEARLLNIETDMPLFVVRAVSRLADDRLLEVSRTAWIASRVRFESVFRPDRDPV